MWKALNEAKVVFGRDKRVVALLVELSTADDQGETPERLAVVVGQKQRGFSTKGWPQEFIETVIAGRGSRQRNCGWSGQRLGRGGDRCGQDLCRLSLPRAWREAGSGSGRSGLTAGKG